MAMETFINGFMLLHQKLEDVDYKVDDAALVSVFVSNMNQERFGSIFRILRMATPINDIEIAYKVANHAAEQLKLQKPDLNRVTSHSASYANDGDLKAPSLPRARLPSKKPAGPKRSSSPAGAKRAFSPRLLLVLSLIPRRCVSLLLSKPSILGQIARTVGGP